MLDRILSLFIEDIPAEFRRAFIRILFRAIFIFHIAWSCGWLIAFGIPGFAQASDVSSVRQELAGQIQEVKQKMQSVEDSVLRSQQVQTRTAYESELRRLNQEIFTLEAKVRELQREGARVDRIYDERLSDLQEERRRVENRLQAFLRANPNIAGATF